MERPAINQVQVSYSEMLRLVGSYVDRAHMSEIRVLETDDGMILQGLMTQGEHAGERTTFQLTTEDLQMLLENAVLQRSRRSQG